jgi:hypothetical protein
VGLFNATQQSAADFMEVRIGVLAAVGVRLPHQD